MFTPSYRLKSHLWEVNTLYYSNTVASFLSMSLILFYLTIKVKVKHLLSEFDFNKYPVTPLLMKNWINVRITSATLKNSPNVNTVYVVHTRTL